MHLPARSRFTSDWDILRSIVKFGLPAGLQGIAMNVAGVLLLRFIGSLPQSAEAQAAYAVGYTELFSFITWTSVGLMGATAAVAGQALGANRPERAVEAARTAARMGLGGRRRSSARCSCSSPRYLLGAVRHARPGGRRRSRTQLLRYLAVSGFFISVALTYTGALQGTGDTRSPLYISLVSQIVVPDRALHDPAGDERLDAGRHLAGHRARPRHALRAVGRQVPAGQVAQHRGRHRPGPA